MFDIFECCLVKSFTKSKGPMLKMQNLYVNSILIDFLRCYLRCKSLGPSSLFLVSNGSVIVWLSSAHGGGRKVYVRVGPRVKQVDRKDITMSL